MLKRIISVVTAVALAITMVFTFDMPNIVALAVTASGTYDSGLTWSLDNSGKLTISGSGDMPYLDETRRPYREHLNNITSVVIENGVGKIGGYAFYNCTALKNVTISNSVTQIEDGAFNECTALETIVIPNSVTIIGSSAFTGCTKLKNMTISNSLKTINRNAFNGCTALETITIPSSVTFIGISAFSGCSNLKNVTLESTTPPRAGAGAFPSDVTSLNVPCSALDTYKSAAVWSTYAAQIQPKHSGATEVRNVKAATCTAKGYTGDTYCKSCDTKLETGTEIAMTAHNYSSAWSYDDTNHYHECTVCGDQKDTAAHRGGTATCQTQATCSVCGQKYGSVGAHNYSDDWTKGDTQHYYACLTSGCTDKGDAANHTFVQKSDGTNHWQECSVCGYKKDETAHSWSDWTLTTEPTLNTTGTAERTCGCGKKQTKADVPALTDTTVWTKDGSQHVDPTEEDTGKDVYTSEYGDVEVVLPKKEHTHDWSNWSITANPTLTATGTAERACTKDGTHTETKELPVLTDTTVWTKDGSQHVDPTEEDTGKDVYTSEYGNVEVVLPKKEHTHVLVKTDAQAADCTTNGNEAYWTCSGCNKMFSDENGTMEITAIPTIPSTGHAYSTDWTSDSTFHWHAATCGHDVISEAAAHTEDGGTVTVPATTENDGLKTYACSVCGYVMRTVTIPKLGENHNHSFSPDWKHDGTSHWHECDCGEKNEIAPHVEDGGVVTTEPTETSTGIMTYSCGTCGYVMRTDVIPARVPEHNHIFGTDWKYDSVSHWHECECGEKSDIANHISSDWIVVIPATTDLEGVQIRKCTVCGIELDRETIEKLPNISTGDVVEDVQDTAGTNAGLVQDNTLIENVLTPDDKTEVTEGHSFEIVLEVTDIRDSVPAADVAAASSALRYNEQIGIYVDLSLFKIKDNSERTPIYNTSGRIGITLTVPDSIYASDRTYSIIRVHDGIAENLGGTYDRTSRELTFYTDKFSTYAIAYTASNGGTDRPNVPDTPTKPTTPTVPSTPTNPSVPTYPTAPVKPVTPTVTETTVKKEDEVISDEPYVEDVSSAAGIYESGEADNNIHYVMILIFAAAAGIAAIAAKKYFCKKNMK